MSRQIDNSFLELSNMLKMIFNQREDAIYPITINEKKLLQQKSKDYTKMYAAIDNIPDAFVEKSVVNQALY